MHYMCFLAVEADTHTDALAAVDAFLTPYGESVYDWYVVGGRWSGAVGGQDLACAGTDRRSFLDAVQRGVAARNEEWHRVRQHLVGPDPRVPLHDAYGLVDDADTTAVAAWHERVHDGYRTSADQFAALLQSMHAPSGRDGHGLLPWHLLRLGDMLLDQFASHSYFYDTVASTHGPSALHERVAANPARQWIVVIDMHN